MAVSTHPRYYDAENRPPRPGGWHYFLFPDTRKGLVQGGSPGDVHEEIKRYRVNNGTFVSDIALERELWAYWCSLEPSRCIGPSNRALLPGEQGKESYGPWIWNFLNWAAVNWNERFFLALVREIAEALLPCPMCAEEWKVLLRAHPPTNINSAYAACRWVNDRHNEVNARLGKPHFPYSAMAVQYGAPLNP